MWLIGAASPVIDLTDGEAAVRRLPFHDPDDWQVAGSAGVPAGYRSPGGYVWLEADDTLVPMRPVIFLGRVMELDRDEEQAWRLLDR